MQKSEYYQMVGKRLLDAMERLHYTQQQVLLKCVEQGYTINQSSLSKMLSGGSIQTLQIAQICKVLALNISEVLSLDPSIEVYVENQQIHSEQIITDAQNSAFRGYKGTYSAYFYTTKNEDSIHLGTFKIQENPTTGQCMADFRFKTGEKMRMAKTLKNTTLVPYTTLCRCKRYTVKSIRRKSEKNAISCFTMTFSLIRIWSVGW